ncbi:26S proteasome non-ATPase regulatory subunit, putative [Eimeria tenella]|uniref:26S proteasome non-ATPase regulatory subunit, putative n=1 Tax=Eimeria tenella TaxID=5802 RepID=U6KVD2_EIMTE|nr:26S proteasome non-ATPase regulatory subunit, putative [Eimeria tenella]CDJ42092.1 26S proteasome non-ATPase regulatory subunit, putative [Eimeria tenella]|eukprot:XP_013232842.1 26S proteasome non-ATPase regulatory subunit, putative [Eimeria tenella]
MAQDTASAILKDEEALGLREEKKTQDFSAEADALIQRMERAREASRQAWVGGWVGACKGYACKGWVWEVYAGKGGDQWSGEWTLLQIFVEVERARLILLAALMKEEAGDVEGAALMLQDVQVETFGAMDREEKTKYILKQMMLLLRKSDFIRCQIVSKKLSPKLLEAADLQVLKVKYYELMTVYYLHEDALLDVAKCFGHIYNTQIIRDDPARMNECLEFFSIFMVLAPFDSEAQELISKTLKEEIKKLQQLPTFEQLLRDLSGEELLSWPLPYDENLHMHAAFGEDKFPGGEKRWTLLRKRVIQHNLRVLCANYSVIHLQRVASLLGIPEEEAESELSELASAGVLDAKIDRPARTVAFGKPKTDLVVLEEWSSSLSKLLDKVDLCCHMIQKERMVHAARAKAAAANARMAS